MTSELRVDAIKTTDGTEVMSFNSDGSINQDNKIAFEYGLASDFTMTTGVWTVVALDTKRFEYGGDNFNTTNNRFVAPRAGLYMFSAQVQWKNATTSGGYNYAGLWKNGNAHRYFTGARISSQAFNSDYTQAGSVLMDLAVNDYVQLAAYQNSSSPVLSSGGLRTHLSGYFVG